MRIIEHNLEKFSRVHENIYALNQSMLDNLNQSI